MLGTLSKTAVVATAALIIGLAPIATADLAFARGGGGGGIHMGGGGGGHFGGGQFGGGHFVVGSPAAPFVKEDFIVTSAGLAAARIMPIAAAPTVIHTRLTAPTATPLAIDQRGPMGEADVGLTAYPNASLPAGFSTPALPLVPELVGET